LYFIGKLQLLQKCSWLIKKQEKQQNNDSRRYSEKAEICL